MNDSIYLKAMRKASRELEIELHGKQISRKGAKQFASKRDYNRQQAKRVLFE